MERVVLGRRFPRCDRAQFPTYLRTDEPETRIRQIVQEVLRSSLAGTGTTPGGNGDVQGEANDIDSP
jgi:hypothetical protein